MIASNNNCLSDTDLRDFSAGRLPNDRFADFLSHIDSCAACQGRAESSAELNDSLAASLAAPSDDECPIISEPDCQAALFHAANVGANRFDSVLPPIEQLGPYRLLRPIGRGGMGAVYLAEHVRLRKKCAIKLLPRERGFDADWLGRFEREMQAVASLQHPNIVTATDAGEVDGWHYLVMEYLDGVDLSALTRRYGPIPIDAAAAIGRDVCRALAVVHDAGLIHRDIKPSNAMLTREGTVKLLDLGLVLSDRAATDDMRLTTVGHVMGTLAFAAPEQLSADTRVDSRADLYGAGATLFQLIAGQSAHAANRGIAPLVIEKSSKRARSLSSIRPDVPMGIDTLVSRLLDRDPQQRPSDARDVADELATYASTNALKRIAKEAIRIQETGESNREPYGIGGIGPKPTSIPPRNRRWIAVTFGAAALIAAFIFYIKTDQGVLVIESEVEGLTVSIKQADQSVDAIEVEQGENRTTLRSGNYSIGFDAKSDNVSISESEVVVRRGEETIVKVRQQSEPAADKIVGEQELYKGKPFSYWVQIVKIERDVATLKEAMRAITSLSGPDDIEAAEAILIAARRFGGWVLSGGDYSEDGPFDGGSPGHYFMHTFNSTFQRMLPVPGISAIANELKMGNANSRAACLWALQNFAAVDDDRSRIKLGAWAADPKNHSISSELHAALQQLLRVGIDEPKETSNAQLSRNACRDISIQLALVLSRPLAEEPNLKSNLLQRLVEIRAAEQKTTSLRERLDNILHDQGWVEKPDTGWVSPYEYLAATELQLDVPPRIAVQTIFGNVHHDGSIADKIAAQSAEFSDETLAWIGTNMSWAVSSQSWKKEDWIKLMPILVSKATRPEVAIRVFVRFLDDGENEIFGNHDGVQCSIEPMVKTAISAAIRVAEERLFQDLNSMDSLPESVSREQRDLASTYFQNQNVRFLPLDELVVQANPGCDWNADGQVTEAELAWHFQKRNWEQMKIPGVGRENFGGGGMF